MKDGQTPKLLETIFAFYSSTKTVVLIALSICFIRSLNPFILGLIIFIIFFFTPLLYRALKSIFNESRGRVLIGKYAKYGSIWVIGFHLQQFYTSFRSFERFMILIPGLYSFWLRLWGAKIGKKIIWTPQSLIVDRPHVEIGDKTLIGNYTYISAHYIVKIKKKYYLIISNVKVGSDCVLSYQCTVAPGSIIEDTVFMEAASVTYPNETIKEGTRHERFREILSDRFNFVYEEFRKRSSTS